MTIDPIIPAAGPADGKSEEPPQQWEPLLKGLGDAWPSLFTAAIYFFVGLHGFSFLDFTRAYLVKIMQIEFLVIHAGAMLMGLAAARQSKTKNDVMAEENPTALVLKEQKRDEKVRRILGWAFWGLLALYVLMSFTFAWYGPLLFLYATAATFWGVGRGKLTSGSLLVLLIRWFVTVVVFVVAIGTQHLPKGVESWGDYPETHMAGFLYFLLLGSLEWAGLFRAPWWKKIEFSASQDRNRGD